MLPGIIVPYAKNLPTFSIGVTVAINTESTMSPLAVGIALKSSHDIFYSSGTVPTITFYKKSCGLNVSYAMPM